MALFRRVLLILALIVAPAMTAAAATGPASKFINQLGSDALRMLAEKATPDKREAEFRRLFLKNFDVDTIARFVTGNYWRSANDAQRAEFRKLFEDYVVSAYVARLSAYSGEQFQVKDEVAAGDDIVVNSTIVRPSGPPVRVEWRVRSGSDGPRIIDVIVEGVSMAITQRSEFAAVMQQGGKGLASLNEKLRAKLIQPK
jgi:phospholipid transport system substrate-binding protein